MTVFLLYRLGNVRHMKDMINSTQTLNGRVGTITKISTATRCLYKNFPTETFFAAEDREINNLSDFE